MSDTKFLRVIILCLIVLNIGTLSYLLIGRTERSPRPGGPPRVIEYLSSELNFDESQKMTVMKLRDENREEIEEIQKGDRKLHDSFFDLLNQNDPDSAVIDSMASLIASNRKQIELLTFQHFSEIRKVCTEEQKQKFDVIINDALRMMAPRPPR